MEPGTHEIRVFKATEPQWVARVPAPNWVTFHGIVLNSGEVLPPARARPTRRLEFVGDSITAGYCNLCVGPDKDIAHGRRRRRAAAGIGKTHIGLIHMGVDGLKETAKIY